MVLKAQKIDKGAEPFDESKKRQPGVSHPTDLHVGERLRIRRTMVGMSQEALGKAIGLTFQQVQKYERGLNRIGASRLWAISKALDVEISFFFEGLSRGGNSIVETDPLLDADILKLMRDINKLPEALKISVRDMVTAFMESLKHKSREANNDKH